MQTPGSKFHYKVYYSSDVIKYDIPKLDNKIKGIIKRKIEKLIYEPYLGLPLKGKLAKLYKLKVSKYRVVYETDSKNQTVIIIAVGKRADSYIYKIAEKRI